MDDAKAFQSGSWDYLVIPTWIAYGCMRMGLQSGSEDVTKEETEMTGS